MSTLWTQTEMPNTSQLKKKEGFPRGINAVAWGESVGDQVKQIAVALGG